MPPREADDSLQTSLSLLRRARLREEQAWERLIRQYRPLIHCWAQFEGLQDSDAADVSQEVLVVVFSSLIRFRRDRPGDTFRGWLRTITRHKVLDFCRARDRREAATGGTVRTPAVQQRPQATELFDDDRDDLVPEPSRSLLLEALDQLRSEFEPRTWQAFIQSVEGRKAVDIGMDLGMSTGSVYVAKSRVLRRIREKLGACS